MATEFTLVYTDVVDSTAVNARIGDAAMAAVWTAHDRGSRDLLAQWRGSEVLRGDGLMAVFEDVADAAAFTEAYHRLLAALPVVLSARAGVHRGCLELRHNSSADVALGAPPLEVLGLGKAVVARLMALARGGQTLASADTAAALASSGCRCRSHGYWRLKGLEEPLEVFEIGGDGAAMLPPLDTEKAQRVLQIDGAWVGLAQRPGNLPAERDSFLGRNAELRALDDALHTGPARLVTLLGSGGMGKTRLALRHAWAWQGAFSGGQWFCDLSSARTLDDLLLAVAHGLDVPLGTDPLGQIGRAIAGRGSCLVILDNFEQVVVHAAETLGRWLDVAPRARFVVTSRERMKLPGEQSLHVDSLDLPSALELFKQRATAVDRSYRVDAESMGIVRRLVELLDRQPLAIELAAARVRVLPPAAMLAGMDDRFRLLAAGGGRPDRQATLRATFQWSWELLAPAEQSALAQLSVFNGSFSLSSAAAVVDLSHFEAGLWLVDVLHALVDKSLARAPAPGRFELLQGLRHFAEGKLGQLTDPNGQPDLVRLRYARHFGSLDEIAATAGHCIELDNLMRACRVAVDVGEHELATRCLVSSWAALRLTGPFQAGTRLAEEVATMSDLGPTARAWTDFVAGASQHLLGMHLAAQNRLRAGLARLPPDAPPILRARLHCALAEALGAAGQFDETAGLLNAARAAADAARHPATQTWVLNARAWIAERLGRPQEAEDCYRRALQIAESVDDQRWQGGLLGNLGTLHYAAGRLDDACRCFEQALRMTLACGDRRWAGNTHCNLGLILDELGKHEQAAVHHEMALAVAGDLGHQRLQYTVLCNLGLSHLRAGRVEAACEALESAVRGAASLGASLMEAEFRRHLARGLIQAGRSEDGRSCLKCAIELATLHPNAQLAADLQTDLDSLATARRSR